MTSQAAQDVSDTDLQFLSDAVISLDLMADHQTVDVTKFRGPPVQRGPHSFEITESGITVWPRLQPLDRTTDYPAEKLSSGVPELDQLLEGGLDRGTMTFFSGPTGAGKTTISMQFVQEAASRGKRSLILSFEESRRTLLQRSETLNIPVSEMVEQGKIDIMEVRPREYSVNQLISNVRSAVEDAGVELVLIDGLQGFKQNVRGLGGEATEHLAALGRYLHDAGVTSLVTNEVHDITGEFRVTEDGLSNLADNIVFLRHVEYQGTMQKIIGVLKMRTSDFEDTLRRLDFTEYGISVGDPLEGLHGVLTGTPEFEGTDAELGANDGN